MYSASYLEKFIKEIFTSIGTSENDAIQAAKVLISADLRGVDSHGVARLSGYVRLWEKQRLNSNPKIKIIHETPSTAVIDGDLGAGLIVAPFAMKIAIEKAKNVGSGWVAIRNSNHFGIAGYHSMLALEHDMIGFSMTNASPLVAPTFSTSKFLGTNPISIAIPAGKQPPVVIDMATTSVANGKLEVLQRKNMSMPEGWAQDSDGNPTTDAAILKKGGAMLPLGSDRIHGSHKGYCLSSWVDIFSAVLSGANYGPWVPPFVAYIDPIKESVGDGIGHFVGAWRVDAFRKTDEFKSHMDNWIEKFRSATPAKGEEKVLIPGDPEREITKERLKNGINLLPAVVADLKELGKKYNIIFSDN
ncbi:MAG: Ldh family oxidoreductase [Marinilabiliaceae bacterium]|nr:Ldh family oxidoreductase [Marinilabiliaceae bacterium]